MSIHEDAANVKAKVIYLFIDFNEIMLESIEYSLTFVQILNQT